MTRLRCLLVGGPMYEPLYRRIADFRASSGVDVEVELSRNHPDLNDRIATEFGNGTADYDLISTHTKYAPSQAEWLTAITELAHAVSDVAPQLISMGTIGGELLNVPRIFDVKLLHYRTDLVATPPQTWDELAELAERIGCDEVAGFIFPGAESGLFGHFYELCAMGGSDLFESNGSTSVGLHTSADSVGGRWALDILIRLYATAHNPALTTWLYDEVAEQFRSGRAAMSTDWPGGYAGYLDPSTSAIADCVGVALYPTGPACRAVYGGCHSFAIPHTVRNRAAALELLKFLTSTESQMFEASFGSVPTRRSALARVTCEASSDIESARWKALSESADVALVPPAHPRYPDLEDHIWRTVQSALTGDLSVSDALRQIDAWS